MNPLGSLLIAPSKNIMRFSICEISGDDLQFFENTEFTDIFDAQFDIPNDCNYKKSEAAN